MTDQTSKATAKRLSLTSPLLKTMSISSFTDELIATTTEMSASPLLSPAVLARSHLARKDDDHYISRLKRQSGEFRRRRSFRTDRKSDRTAAGLQHPIKTAATAQTASTVVPPSEWTKCLPVYFLVTMSAISLQIWSPMLPFLLKDIGGGQIEVRL